MLNGNRWRYLKGKLAISFQAHQHFDTIALFKWNSQREMPVRHNIAQVDGLTSVNAFNALPWSSACAEEHISLNISSFSVEHA